MKGPLGIILFSIIYLVLGIIFLFVSIYPVLLWITNSPELSEYVGDEISFASARYIYAAISIPPILLIISSILLYKLNSWGHRLALISLILQIFFLGIVGMLIIPLIVFHIIYFNKENVKTEFKI